MSEGTGVSDTARVICTNGAQHGLGNRSKGGEGGWGRKGWNKGRRREGRGGNGRRKDWRKKEASRLCIWRLKPCFLREVFVLGSRANSDIRDLWEFRPDRASKCLTKEMIGHLCWTQTVRRHWLKDNKSLLHPNTQKWEKGLWTRRVAIYRWDPWEAHLSDPVSLVKGRSVPGHSWTKVRAALLTWPLSEPVRRQPSRGLVCRILQTKKAV